MIEFLNEFTEFFLKMVFFYFIAWTATLFVQGWLEAKNKELEAVVRHLDNLIRAVKVETHGEMTYWFDAENDRFIAQGRTQDEIVAILKERFPKNIFLLEKVLLAGPDFKPVPVTDEDAHKLSIKFKL